MICITGLYVTKVIRNDTLRGECSCRLFTGNRLRSRPIMYDGVNLSSDILDTPFNYIPCITTVHYDDYSLGA